MTEYDCIFSGKSAQPELCIEGDEDSDLDDMPVGWIEIKITRRFFNPRYLQLLKVRKDVIDGQIERIESESGPITDEQKEGIEIYNLALTAGAEKSEYFTKFVEVPMHVYVSPPDEDSQVRAAFVKALKALKLDEDQIEELVG